MSGLSTQQGPIQSINIGDDYVSANGSAFVFLFKPPTGLTDGGTCHFGGRAQVGDTTSQAWTANGTLTDLGSSTFLASFDVADIAEGKSPGFYDWSMKVKDTSDNETTIARGTINLVRDVSGVTT